MVIVNQTQRRRQRGAARERILTHAIELLARHGLDAMTMRQLGEAVGLDNSSLYRHFRGKAELVNAALDRVGGEVLVTVGESLDPTRPVTLQALEDTCAAATAYFFDHPSAARLMMHWFMSMGDMGPGFLPSVPADDRRRPHGKLLELLSNWLESGAQSGAIRRYAKPDAIVVLLGIILMRPATHNYLLRSLEPTRSLAAARKAWLRELRAIVRGAFAP